jgi:hypothetical protein
MKTTREIKLTNKETGLDAMAGDGGYSLSTLEKYEEFNKKRNYRYAEIKRPGYTVRQFLKNIFRGYLEHK